MKFFRKYVLATIFIGWALLSISQGIAQSANSGKSEISLSVTAFNEQTGASFEPTKEKIKIFLDNKEQTITSIVPAETPAKIIFMVDFSGSMRHLFSDPLKIKVAFRQFFQASISVNEYALVAFNADAALVKDWTKKPEEIITGLDLLTAQKPNGKTALFDSLVTSMNYLSTSDSKKKAVVLITDGVDRNSMLKRQEITAKIGEFHIPLYCIFLEDKEGSGLFGASSVKLVRNTMIEMGKSAGGDIITVSELADLDKVFVKIGNQIRHQFLVKFIPSTNDDKRVNIKLKFFSSTNSSQEMDNLKLLYPQYYFPKKP